MLPDINELHRVLLLYMNMDTTTAECEGDPHTATLLLLSNGMRTPCCVIYQDEQARAGAADIDSAQVNKIALMTSSKSQMSGLACIHYVEPKRAVLCK